MLASDRAFRFKDLLWLLLISLGETGDGTLTAVVPCKCGRGFRTDVKRGIPSNRIILTRMLPMAPPKGRGLTFAARPDGLGFTV